MRRLLLAAALSFLICACEKMPAEKASMNKDAPYFQPVFQLAQDQQEAEEPVQAIETSAPAEDEFHKEPDMTVTSADKKNQGRNIMAILDEVERLLVINEGRERQSGQDASEEEGAVLPSPVSPQRGASELESDINRELRVADLNDVSAEVNGIEVVIKGTVRCREERDKAIQIARGLKGVRSLRDLVFIVHNEEDRT